MGHDSELILIWVLSWYLKRCVEGFIIRVVVVGETERTHVATHGARYLCAVRHVVCYRRVSDNDDANDES